MGSTRATPVSLWLCAPTYPRLRKRPRTRQDVIRDDTGTQPWSRHYDAFAADGRLIEQIVFNRDGSTVISEFNLTGSGNWDERHVVKLADGSIFTFVNSGTHQTVFAGDVTIGKGQVLYRTDFADGVAEPQPQLVRGPPTLPDPTKLIPTLETLRKAGAAAWALFSWRSSQNTQDKTTVLDIPAYEYKPSESRRDHAEWVGTLDRRQTDEACPRFAEVQLRTDVAAASVRPMQPYLSAQQYGTAVHKALKDQIYALDDPGLRAEVSIIKSRDENYGKLGSIRIDVLEQAPNDTVCVYDIKTGNAKLSLVRVGEIASEVHSLYGIPRRVLVIEVRPRR